MSVTAVELYRLGRLLIDVARQATIEGKDSGLGPVQVALLEDVLHHPQSGVQQIAARTGHAQSHISKVVEQLHQRGLLSVEPSRLDGRRSCIALTPQAHTAITARAGHDVHNAAARILGNAATAAAFITIIDDLHQQLATTNPEPEPVPVNLD